MPHQHAAPFIAADRAPADGPPRVAIVGAGPAGLTAAWLLARGGATVTVLEADPARVGGLSRTVEYRSPAADGVFRFDIGGHRFFSKSAEIEALWSELLGADMLQRPRLSRILYRGRFFAYPLQAREAIFNLGVFESCRCVASYMWARSFPVADPRTFEDWVCNRFGRRLFEIFFKTYTEKVWGMRCKAISADWAAQRIKGFSLGQAVKHALFPPRAADRSRQVKTLIHSFRYPRRGPGMMWEAAADRTRALGGAVRLGCRVTGLERHDGAWRVAFVDGHGAPGTLDADHVVSSAPLSEVVRALSPAPPAEALEAAGALRYRDFLTVALILRPRHPFDDNWIYIHDPAVRVGRIQNFRSWSPEMVPDPSLACYGLEYFCFEGDGLWAMRDGDLVALAGRELVQLGLARDDDILDGCVVRQPKAYPVYDDDYAARVGTIRAALADRYPNLHPVGRNGMHKYNNQDHAMMTAILTARNILAGNERYDPWNVNEDAEYHEADVMAPATGVPPVGSSGLRAVPRRVSSG